MHKTSFVVFVFVVTLASASIGTIPKDLTKVLTSNHLPSPVVHKIVLLSPEDVSRGTTSFDDFEGSMNAHPLPDADKITAHHLDFFAMANLSEERVRSEWEKSLSKDETIRSIPDLEEHATDESMRSVLEYGFLIFCAIATLAAVLFLLGTRLSKELEYLKNKINLAPLRRFVSNHMSDPFNLHQVYYRRHQEENGEDAVRLSI